MFLILMNDDDPYGDYQEVEYLLFSQENDDIDKLTNEFRETQVYYTPKTKQKRYKMWTVHQFYNWLTSEKDFLRLDFKQL